MSVGIFNKLLNICKNKMCSKITSVLLYILIIIALINFVTYLYQLKPKKILIEGNDNIVQSQCNISSSDSPEDVSKKFNTIKTQIDSKLSELTEIANKVQNTLHPK
jgi:hypothetical protein